MIRRAIVPVAVLAVAGLGLALVPAGADAAKRKRPVLRDVLYVGNNWDGTADVVDPRRFKRLARINIIPDIAERMRRDRVESRAARLLPRDPPGGRRGARPVRRRHVLVARRPLPLRLAAEPRRRRRDRPAHPEDRLAHQGRRATAPTTWRSHPTASTLLVSASTGQGRRRDRHEVRADRRRASRAGDQPHESNFSKDGKRDLPREHRLGLHAARRPDLRRHQGRARLRGRRREHTGRS